MKILVVDDEPLARQRLLRLVSKLRPDAECGEAGDGEGVGEEIEGESHVCIYRFPRLRWAKTGET